MSGMGDETGETHDEKPDTVADIESVVRRTADVLGDALERMGETLSEALGGAGEAGAQATVELVSEAGDTITAVVEIPAGTKPGAYRGSVEDPAASVSVEVA